MLTDEVVLSSAASPNAFPLRGRWHDEVVTDEVLTPTHSNWLSGPEQLPTYNKHHFDGVK